MHLKGIVEDLQSKLHKCNEKLAITEQSVGIELAPAPADVLAAAPSAAAAGEENSPAPFIKRRLSMAGNMTNV